MRTLADPRQRLRDRAEHHLLLAAMEDLRARYPEGTTPPYRRRGELFWRRVFVPLYRRVPWSAKERAMHALGMTAERAGWTPPARRPGRPWAPPPRDDDSARMGAG
jgi:hypothetical protein